MRLLIVSQYFWPEDFRINDLVDGMRARGHEVTVLTGLPNYPEGRVFEDYRQNPARFADYDGIEVVRVPIVPRGTGSLRLALNYLSFVITASTLGVWKLRGRPFDAIFVFQTSPVTAALPALILRRTKHAPVLMWILDLWPETLSAVGAVRSPKLLGLIGALVSFIYRRCDRILVQSRAFVAKVERVAGGAEKIRYFPNWAEPIFAGGLEGVEPAPEMSSFLDTFNLMFAGNIGEAQDFPAILDAAEASQDIEDLRWLIVGDGRARDMVCREIERRRLEERVILLGRHPVERMPAFFRGADALLVSLKEEPVWSMTIPGKVQSYLASGLPLVAMLNGEGARVIEESGGGMTVPAGDGTALADAVRRLHAISARERRLIGDRAQAYCRREFEREALLSELESWMDEVRGVVC